VLENYKRLKFWFNHYMESKGTVKKKLVLIDSNALMHRAYHALPPLTDKKGQVVNAVYGFTSLLLKILKEMAPDYIICTFDMAAPTFRHNEFEEYKAHRVKAPEEFYTQIPKIKEIISAFGIPICEKEGFEADDVIGTLTVQAPKIFGAAPYEIVILTGDLDTLQLVNKNVKICTFKKGISDTVIYDEKAIEERYGLSAGQMVDYKGLRGDPSDNIPGVPGIGEKTAIALLKEFGSIDNIYNDFEKAKEKIKPKLAKKLEEFRKQAYFSKYLASIRFDVPIDFDPEESKVKKMDKEKIIKLFQELNFFSLIGRLNNNGGALPLDSESKQEIEKKDEMEKVNVLRVKSAAEARQMSERIKKAGEFAFDARYEVKNYCHKIIAMGIASGGNAWNIDLNGTEILGDLKNIFEDGEIKKIGHDVKTGIKALKDAGIDFIFSPSNGVDLISRQGFDTMIAAYLLFPGKRDYSLEKISFEHLGAESTSAEIALRAGVILKLAKNIREDLEKKNLMDLAREIEFPLIAVLARMEIDGVKIDKERLESFSSKLAHKIDGLKKNIFSLAGQEFNINSTRELSAVLFEKLNIPAEGVKRTKTNFSTAADTLALIKPLHPIVELIIQYRELAKIKSTYADALPLLVNPETGRVHTSFNQALTATGRLSSSDPNLQNIPVKTEIGNEIRMAFVPKEKNWKLMSFDYSQIELRIIASMANDAKMIGIFSDGGDIHAQTAAEVYEIPLEKVTDKMRNEAKALNFGIIYGMSVHGFSEATGMSRAEAKEFIDKYLAKFSAIDRFRAELIEEARIKGYAKTIFGRIRLLPELKSPNFQVRSAAERMAINMPVQGTAADIIKLAMISIYKKYKNDRNINLILQVHDELVFEIKNEDPPAGGEKYAKEISEIMENIYLLKAPLKVSAYEGENWGEMKELIF